MEGFFTARSRNSRCSFERGLFFLVGLLELKESGLGSVEGGEDEVVIRAY